MSVLKDKKGTRSIEGITLNFEKNRDLSSKNIYWMNFQRWPGLASATAYLKEINKKCFAAQQLRVCDLWSLESLARVWVVGVWVLQQLRGPKGELARSDVGELATSLNKFLSGVELWHEAAEMMSSHGDVQPWSCSRWAWSAAGGGGVQ
ncbi:hypothetical protein LOK49_LG11G01362 [Camellia lanceoleosa]|uniref:Uncharacterized protein n=1 Tax=Camellia lanceoleosa TaxID=1840588 RepID=A0ACC0FZ01_9ERIC|nr:hypothetical protein LOK49_LG11G01362 [Camellia lanceoleosa]